MQKNKGGGQTRLSACIITAAPNLILLAEGGDYKVTIIPITKTPKRNRSLSIAIAMYQISLTPSLIPLTINLTKNCKHLIMKSVIIYIPALHQLAPQLPVFTYEFSCVSLKVFCVYDSILRQKILHCGNLRCPDYIASTRLLIIVQPVVKLPVI